MFKIKIQINYPLIESESWVVPMFNIYITHPSMQVTQSRRGYMHESYGSASVIFLRAVSQR